MCVILYKIYFSLSKTHMNKICICKISDFFSDGLNMALESTNHSTM